MAREVLCNSNPVSNWFSKDGVAIRSRWANQKQKLSYQTGEVKYMTNNRIKLGAAVAVLAYGLSGAAWANPVQIGLGGFSGSETVINFNSIGNEVQINNQFSGQGATFSGPLYGMTNPGDTSKFPGNGGGVIASNWRYSLGSAGGYSFDVAFNQTETRVGFYVETNDPDNTTLAVYAGSTLLGSLLFDSKITAAFFGAEDLAGFNNITISVQNNLNGFIAIDDLRFENSSVNGVPEGGATLLLMGLTTSGLVAWQRRSNRRVAQVS